MAALHPRPTVFCISVGTPDSTDRTQGRQRIRAALRDVLHLLLDIPPERIELQSTPGQSLALAGYAIGLSLAHEPGLSVAAINLAGAVGVDLLQVAAPHEFFPDWENLSRDYLGPDATRRIVQAGVKQRPQVFAEEWSAREAWLKCRGQGLLEWDNLPQADAASMRRYRISCPAMIGTVITNDLPGQ